MKLRCRINEKEYDIVQGAAFSEEYNETLDSGTIIITHEPKIDLKPYDDVYIWDAEHTFEGFTKNTIFFDGNEYYIEDYYNSLDEFEKPNDGIPVNNVFYRHLLVDNFSEKMINLRDFSKKEKGVGEYIPIYEYTIQLFSETKALEVIQLPNISITQALEYSEKISVWDYIQRFLELYSPVYKLSKDGTTWEFEKKYSISASLKKTFSEVFSPDFSLNNPNLKEVISKLLLTKDMIPYVKNNVIYALDITVRRGNFDIDLNHINYISGNMTSNDYCDNLKKTYSDALSQNNTSRCVEFLGFRNSSTALMTLENMRLETRFPIYKINKIYMCYYKKIKEYDKNGVEQGTHIFLCKQDITPLIKLNTERNLLSQDWSEAPTSVEEMGQYKFFTLGYDIGSKNITGWGERHTYPLSGVADVEVSKSWYDITKSYIQNIIEKLDSNDFYPFGIYTSKYLKNKLNISEDRDIRVESNTNFYDNLVTAFDTNVNGIKIPVLSLFGDDVDLNENPLKFKSFIFQIDYQGFYNGTTIHSKDLGLDNITINDNPSASLTLLEQDGLFTKEKANRFGNKGLTINGRYDDISQLQILGSVYEDYDNKDVIIYHREYQIWNNEVIATYYGIHDYVLKNFYTSVYARHRTWNLMPYNESVRRSENKKTMIYFSKDNLYYESFQDEDIQNFKFKMNNFVKLQNDDGSYYSQQNIENISALLSLFHPTNKPRTINYFYDNFRLNYAFYSVAGRYFATDLNCFVNGYSLCMNMSMNDNISAGNCIDETNPKFNDEYNITKKTESGGSINWKAIGQYLFMKDVENDYTGSTQKWTQAVQNLKTGSSDTMGFFVCHLDENDYFDSIISSDSEVKKIYEQHLLFLPEIQSSLVSNRSNSFENYFTIYKDNKEVIDMTYQIEPITNDSNVIFSQWLMKLSDLVSSYKKFETGVNLTDENVFSVDITGFKSVYERGKNLDLPMDGPWGDSLTNPLWDRSPVICIKLEDGSESKSKILEYLRTYGKLPVEASYVFDSSTAGSWREGKVTSYIFSIKYINSIGNDGEYNYIDVSGVEEIWYSTGEYKRQELSSLRLYQSIYYRYKEKCFVDLGGTTDDQIYMCIRNIFAESTYGVIGSRDWEFDANCGGIMRPDTFFEEDNSSVINAMVVRTFPGKVYTKYYPKNMVVCFGNEKMKKQVIYNEHFYVDDYSMNATYDVGDYVLRNVPYSITTTTNGVVTNVKWYDNMTLYKCKAKVKQPMEFKDSYWQLIAQEYVTHPGSYNPAKKMVVSGNLCKITEDEDYWKKMAIKSTNLETTKVFSIEKDETNFPYIKIDLSGFKKEETKSIQYWYKENGSIKFVFGVNLSDDYEDIEIDEDGNEIKKIVNVDWDRGYAKVYISLLSTRDMRVYDNTHRLIGKSSNLIESGKSFNGQYIDKKTEKIILKKVFNLNFDDIQIGSEYDVLIDLGIEDEERFVKYHFSGEEYPTLQCNCKLEFSIMKIKEQQLYEKKEINLGYHYWHDIYDENNKLLSTFILDGIRVIDGKLYLKYRLLWLDSEEALNYLPNKILIKSMNIELE